MQFSRLVAFASLATCSQVALGAIYSDPSQLPTNRTYDYIVVGCEYDVLYSSVMALADAFVKPVLVEESSRTVFQKMLV